MKALCLLLLVAAAVRAQDGSYVLDSRGVQLNLGLTPPAELLQKHQEYSQATPTRYSANRDSEPEYAWAYEVDARSTGDRKAAREERRGDYVQGQYSVVDPDGSLRTVDYSVAPATGFQATVNTEDLNRGQSLNEQSSRTRFQGSQKFRSGQTNFQGQNHFQNQRYNQDHFQNQNQFGNQDRFQSQDRFRSQEQERFSNQQYNQEHFQNQKFSQGQFESQFNRDRFQTQENFRSQSQQNYRQGFQNQKFGRSEQGLRATVFTTVPGAPMMKTTFGGLIGDRQNFDSQQTYRTDQTDARYRDQFNEAQISRVGQFSSSDRDRINPKFCNHPSHQTSTFTRNQNRRDGDYSPISVVLA